MPRPELSLVIPIYNEEECLPQLDVRLKELLGKLGGTDTEVVFVNDGSKDKSIEILRRMASHELRYRVLGFSRNFGHQRAITAGMDKSRGQAVVVMDADLQDPPEVILDMVAKWREGYDVVYGRRKSRVGESFFKLLTAKIFYRLFAALIPIEVPLDTGDFRLMSRRVVTTMRGLRETHRFVRGLVAWVGFKQTAVEYDRAARAAGKTKYPLRKMLAFAIDGIASFSVQPLRLATYVSIIVGTASVAYAIVAIISWWAGLTLPGWTTTIMLISFLFSVQFFMIGVLGEYVGRIYEQVKRRPLYIVSERINFGRRKVERLITQDIEDFQSSEIAPVVPPVAAFPLTPGTPALAGPPPQPIKPQPMSDNMEIPPPPPALVAAMGAVEAATTTQAQTHAKPSHPPPAPRTPSRAPPALPPAKAPSGSNIHVAPKVAPQAPKATTTTSTSAPPPAPKVANPTPSTPPVKFPSVPPKAPPPAATTTTGTNKPAASPSAPPKTKSGQQPAFQVPADAKSADAKPSPDDTSRDGLPKANPNVALPEAQSESSGPKSVPPKSDPKSSTPSAGAVKKKDEGVGAASKPKSDA